MIPSRAAQARHADDGGGEALTVPGSVANMEGAQDRAPALCPLSTD